MQAVLVVHCNDKGAGELWEAALSSRLGVIHLINAVSLNKWEENLRLHNFPNLVPKSGRQRKKGESRSYTTFFFLHTFYGCFCTATAKFNSWKRLYGPQSRKYLLPDPLQKECQLSLSNIVCFSRGLKESEQLLKVQSYSQEWWHWEHLTSALLIWGKRLRN